MSKIGFKNIFFTMLCLFFCWVIAGYLNAEPFRPRRKSDFIFPSNDIRHFTLGYSEAVSDGYWLRVIQDFDVCVFPKALPNAPRTGVGRKAHCELDWAYHMVDVVTTISPRNYSAYQAGGIMLSIVLDDIEGASRIYNKGLILFPKDWLLNYQAATHFMTETGDLQKAAFFYNRAVENGAPGWVAALSAKLFDKVGRTELAIANLMAQLKRNPDEKFAEAARNKLYELQMKLKNETTTDYNERRGSQLKKGNTKNK